MLELWEPEIEMAGKASNKINEATYICACGQPQRVIEDVHLKVRQVTQYQWDKGKMLGFIEHERVEELEVVITCCANCGPVFKQGFTP